MIRRSGELGNRGLRDQGTKGQGTKGRRDRRDRGDRRNKGPKERRAASGNLLLLLPLLLPLFLLVIPSGNLLLLLPLPLPLSFPRQSLRCCLCPCLSFCHSLRESAFAVAFALAFLSVIPSGNLLFGRPTRPTFCTIISANPQPTVSKSIATVCGNRYTKQKTIEKKFITKSAVLSISRSIIQLGGQTAKPQPPTQPLS